MIGDADAQDPPVVRLLDASADAGAVPDPDGDEWIPAVRLHVDFVTRDHDGRPATGKIVFVLDLHDTVAVRDLLADVADVFADGRDVNTVVADALHADITRAVGS